MIGRRALKKVMTFAVSACRPAVVLTGSSMRSGKSRLRSCPLALPRVPASNPSGFMEGISQISVSLTRPVRVASDAVAVQQLAGEVDHHLPADRLVAVHVGDVAELGLVLLGADVVGDLEDPQVAVLDRLAGRQELAEGRVGGGEALQLGGELGVVVVVLQRVEAQSAGGRQLPEHLLGLVGDPVDGPAVGGGLLEFFLRDVHAGVGVGDEIHIQAQPDQFLRFAGAAQLDDGGLAVGDRGGGGAKRGEGNGQQDDARHEAMGLQKNLRVNESDKHI